MYETFRDSSTHLEKLFVATGSAELSSNMASYMTDQKVFIKTFTVLVVFVLLWRDNIIKNFLFVLHHQDILYTGLLNSFKKQDCVCMCERNLRRDVNSFVHLHKIDGLQKHNMENVLV